MDIVTATKKLDLLSAEVDGPAGHEEADDILLAVLRTHHLGMVADAYERAAERCPFMYS